MSRDDDGFTDLVDNGAGVEIQDLDDPGLPMDVDDDPFMPGAIDEDGYGVPGYDPYKEKSDEFLEEDGVFEKVIDHDNEIDESLERPEDEGDGIFGDEVEEHVRDHDEATYVNGRLTSDLVRHSLVDEKHYKLVRRKASFVRIVPENSLNALMGNTATCVIGAPPIEVGRITGGISGPDSIPVTIAFAQMNPAIAQFSEEGPSIAAFRPYGVVQYGTRNAPSSFEVDIGAGVQFTLGVTSVHILVGLENTLALGGTAGTMELNGQLSYYPVIRGVPITRTKYIDAAVVNDSTVTIPVPRFGRRVTVVNATNSQTQVIEFLNSRGDVVYTDGLTAGTPMRTPIEMSGDVMFVRISTVALGGLTDGCLIFQLAL